MAGEASTQVPAVIDATNTAATSPHEIAFVDLSIDDAQALIDTLTQQRAQGRDLEIITFDAGDDGLAVISRALAARHDMDAVHIFSHGDEQGLQLGATRLDAAALQARLGDIAGWAGALSDQGDLLFYGCNLASSTEGQTLIDNLSLLTGADVAASTNLTGSADLGGDWILEAQTGHIEATIGPQVLGQTSWHGVLGVAATGAETLAHTTTASTSEITTSNRQVAMDNSGNYVAVWQSGSNVYGQRFNADGSMNGSRFTVGAGGTGAGAQVAMNASGAFVVSWLNSSNDLVFQRYLATGAASGGMTTVVADSSVSGSGAFFTPPYTLDTTTPTDATIAIDASGNFVVAYRLSTFSGSYADPVHITLYSSTTTEQIKFQSYNSGGTLTGSGTVSSSTVGNDDPSIAMSATGAFAISYTDASGNIYARLYDAARNPVTAAVDVTNGGGGAQSSIAMDDSGDYVVAYNDAGLIYYRTFNSAGVATSAVIQANANPPDTAPAATRAMPSVTMDAGGNFAIAWQQSGQDGSGYGVYMRQFTSSGVAVRNDIQVATTSAGDQENASVAYRNGRIVAVWSGNGTQTGQADSQGVFHQRYTVTAGPDAPGAITTTAGSLNYIENATSAIDAGLVLAPDPDGDYYTSATVSLTGNFVSAQDILALASPPAGITASYNSGTGVLTLSGTASIAKYQAALRAVTYSNSSENPSTATRTATFTVSDGTATASNTRTITVTAVNDVPVITSNGGGASAGISVAENGTTVTTVTATDADGQTLTYSISGGADAAKFTIDSSTGVLTFVTAPNFESPTDSGANNIYDVIVRVTDGVAADTQALAITVTNVNESPAITSNGGGASASINVAENATAVTTVTATDPDAGATRTYSIIGGTDAARFSINASTGALVFSPAPNAESPTDSDANNVYEVIVQVSDGALTDSQALTVTVTDVDEFDVGAVTDVNAATNTVAENAANGSTVGVTASATDADGSNNAITYSLSNSAGGRFAINAATGVVTVADGSLLNFEVATSHAITVLATSADGSTSSQAFTINVGDVDEFNVGAVTDANAAINTVLENAANGSTVGITATATDADGTNNTITYSLSDSAGGRFTVDASTGIVTVANGALLNYEAATSHAITVLATSADGSTSSQAFTINLSDADEFDVGAVTDVNAAINTVAENTANGSTVGITASATDADGTNNTITYSLSNNAGGRFAIHASTGVVTVANGALLNHEAATSHAITVLATSTDGSASSQAFIINVSDVDEFNVGAVTDANAAINTVLENAANGSNVGITASASDADGTNNTVTYSLSNSAGGRFAINAVSGLVTVANGALLNYEAATSHSITVLATSADGSTSSQAFTINLSDVDEFDVGAITDANGGANAVSEAATNGSAVGVTASAVDLDATHNAVVYSLSDSAGGRFAINATTGVVTVANAGLLDFETAPSHAITVVATSSDGSSSSQSFSIAVLDVSEIGVGAVSDTNSAPDQVGESAANGSAVGITAYAIDADGDAVTYSLSDNAGGRFAIDAITGVVTVLDGSLLDRESAASHDITVLATSADGTTSTQDFSIGVADVDEFNVGAVVDSNVAANGVLENAANGDTVGITAHAIDPDATTSAISYTLSDSAGGRFAIDAVTGVVTVANGSLLNFEAATSHAITVLATSADGSTSSQAFTINVNDVDEFNVGAVTDANAATNTVAENAANGSAVGITAYATDADGSSNAVAYTLSDSAGGRFAIDALTGVVTVANGSLLDRETAASHTITVVATSVDGSSSSQIFAIALADVDEADVGAVMDTHAAANTVAENASNGSVVGITAHAVDADATNSVITYTLSDSAGGRFAINATTGVVTVANGALLNFEASASHAITVLATSADGSTSSQAFAVNVSDVDEFNVGAVTDVDAAANVVAENAANGSAVGITAYATDADGTNNTVTYSLSSNAGGRFAIDAVTGVVTVADGSLLNFEASTSHAITVLATSADGSNSSQSFTISLGDVDEFDAGAVTDGNAATDTVLENAANGSTVGITASASDTDGSNNTITYTLGDSAGGRFAIDAATGVVTVANGALLNYEAATSHAITVLATSADGSTSSQVFTIQLGDADEFAVGAVTDVNAAANVVPENAANGSAVGITAYATDADGTNNTVTYSLSNNAGGRFAIDAATGVVTVANGALLNYEAATSHAITVLATSADGSTSSQVFTINLGDMDEFDVGAVTDVNAAANTVLENAANGSTVGITASASDADGTNNTVTYSLSDSAGGRFTIDASTGVVTVANGSLLDHEAAASHAITVLATSADGSTSSQAFTINLSDVDEFGVGAITDADAAANTVPENAANGSLVGITAHAADIDATNNAVTYVLTDSASGRFAIHAGTGVVTVARGDLLDAEAVTTHAIVITATSQDGSSTSQSFLIQIGDVNEAPSVSLPASFQATEQVPLDLLGTGLSISDRDADTGVLSTTVSVNSGNLTAAPGSTGVSITGSGSSSVVLTGTLTQINDLFAGSHGGTLTYLIDSDTPPAYAGIQLSVNDLGNNGLATALSGQGSSSIQITAVHDAPWAGNDQLSTHANAPLAVGAALLLLNDVSPEGLALSTALSSAPLHGSISVRADGTMVYTPAAGFAGVDSFSYIVQDGTASSNPATVTITVQNPVADGPIVVPVNGGTTTPATPAVTGNTDGQVDQTPSPGSGSGSDTNAAHVEPDPLAGSEADESAGAGPADSAHGGDGHGDQENLILLGRSLNSHPQDGFTGQGRSLLAYHLLSQDYALRGVDFRQELAEQVPLTATGVHDFLMPVQLTLNDNARLREPGTTLYRATTEDDRLPGLAVSTQELQTIGSMLSIGAVWWAARGATLLTSLLAATPMWRTVDPLPVLSSSDGLNGAGDDGGDNNARQAEQMFDEIPPPDAHLAQIG